MQIASMELDVITDLSNATVRLNESDYWMHWEIAKVIEEQIYKLKGIGNERNSETKKTKRRLK